MPSILCTSGSRCCYTAVMRRFLRYLRIAFSATCLIACVLLIVLWVRSYWRGEFIGRMTPSIFLTRIGSNAGSVYFSYQDMGAGVPKEFDPGWSYGHSKAYPNEGRFGFGRD